MYSKKKSKPNHWRFLNSSQGRSGGLCQDLYSNIRYLAVDYDTWVFLWDSGILFELKDLRELKLVGMHPESKDARKVSKGTSYRGSYCT